MKRLILLTALGWTVVALPLFAQTPAVEPAVAGPEISYSEPLAPPMPMNGVQLPVGFASENVRSNILSAGIQLGSGYNDNALVTPGDHVTNVSYLVVPNIQMRRSRERWSLDLAYSPALMVNQQLSEQNQTAHNVSLVMNLALSPHVNLRLRDNFAKTNNLFSGLSGNGIMPSPLQQSNTSLFVPLANSTNNNSGVDLTYRFGANSLVAASGTFYFVNYGKVTGANGAYSLIDSRSAGGNASYAHRFANRHWLGISYGFQQLMFDPGRRAKVQRALAFYSLVITSQLSVSFWAGPQYSKSTGTSVLVAGSGGILPYSGTTKWSPAGGMQFDWQGQRTGLRIGLLQQISDGGGLAEAVTLQQADIELHQQLSRRWTAVVGSAYAINRPLQRVLASPDFRSLQGNAGLEFRISDNLGLSLSYGRQQQTYSYSFLPQRVANQNRFWFNISYFFTRPLGR